MKTVLLSILALLSLISCASDNSIYEDETNYDQSPRYFKFEIIPNMSNPDAYNYLNILAVMDSEDEELNLIGNVDYVNVRTEGNTKMFNFELEIDSEPIYFETTTKVNNIYMPITVGLNEPLLNSEIGFYIKSFANDELVTTEKIEVPEGVTEIVVFPILEWDDQK